MDRCIIGLYYPHVDDGLDPEPQPAVVLRENPGGHVDLLLLRSLYTIEAEVEADPRAGTFVPNPRA